MAMILDAFVGKFVERLAAFVEEEVSSVLGVKAELKSLQKTLVKIGAIFQDAERRRIQDETVKQWLNDLKGVMYDADDILDLCKYKGGRLLQDEPSSSTTPVRCYAPLLSCITNVPFRSDIGRRIKNLNNRLEKIHKEKEMFKFSSEPSRSDDIKLGGVNPRDTCPLDEDNVAGSLIIEATNRLVESIVVVEEEEGKCRVFAVHGMGGIGKTTLAQKVFNEPRIQSIFQVRAWVCVSQRFSGIDLVKEIIKQILNNTASGDQAQLLSIVKDATTKADLLPMLKNVAMGKRLFLLLDDVWAADVWDDLLRTPLQREPVNCCILVTTRNEEVAKRMGAVYVHRVEKLTVEFGWEMLCKRVFINGEEEETIQSLKHIGIEIVEKCDGLPLAIKTIAGVLSGKEKTRVEWEKVVRSNAWSISGLPDGVDEALYLSYDDLPSHLKQCFLYLSLFPEDYPYDVNQLVPLWIAEGLVEPDGTNSLEDTAEDYYKELIRRSLLQPILTDGFDEEDCQYFNQPVCQMHDLLRYLACFLSGNECVCGTVKSITNSIISQARRLYIEDSESEVGEELTTQSLIRSKHLRTFLLPTTYFQTTPCTIENGLISILRLGGLRVLFLNGDWIKHVPDSIGDLIHLRYLNLGKTDVSKLPESLGRLTNLQFLLLNYSRVSELPDSIVRLTNLRQLGMFSTRGLTHVPKGIGKLQQLNYLSGVVMGSDNDNDGKPVPQQGCDLEDLKDLSLLRFLDIRRLERASTGMLQLQRKSHLTRLSLRVDSHSQHIGGDGLQPYDKIEKILNELVPPACLESLTFDGDFCCCYPTWMSTSLLGTLLPRLSHIKLDSFISYPQLPPLGELPQLKSIKISRATAVVTIGSEFMGAGVREGIHELTTTAFPKLESLKFYIMDNLEEWSLGGEIAEERAGARESRSENRPMILFPLLQNLGFYHCSNLRALPISHLPALKTLYVCNCPALRDVGSNNVLQQLSLYDEKMECLPEWLIKLLQLRLQAEDSNFKLILHCCDVGLFSKCLMDGPYWPIIQQIPQVEVDTAGIPGQTKYMRYTKFPFSYTTSFPSGSQDPNV